jgi:putative endopeptidase
MSPKPLILLLAALFVSHHAFATPESGIDFANFDHQIRLQDDLFSAVNGHWMQTTPIPADHSSYGAFNQLQDLSLEESRTLIEQAAQAPAGSADAQKISALYRSFMQQPELDRLGASPISAELHRLSTLKDMQSLTQALGQLQNAPLDLPLQLSVSPDAKNASATLLQISQSGLGLPDRDYYLRDDTRFASARLAYLSYLEKLFTLAGLDDPVERARTTLALETRLARAQWSNVENRDPQRTYNKMSLAELQTFTPGFNWRKFLDHAQLAQVDSLNLTQPTYVQQLVTILHDTPIADWRNYLSARLLDAYAPYLSQPFVDADFAFHQQALSGAQSIRPRWKRGVALVEGAMGQALGKLYVERYFPPSAKARMDQLVANLMTAYRQSISTLDWMSPETRAQAQTKLGKYQVKIGYPDKWRDYRDLVIHDNDLAGNVQRISAFQYAYTMSKLGRPVDRHEWQMTPQTVNAYYDPQLNEIVFPAAILQPPFFNPQADDAVNYGGIGAVIGHEISHGFDDQGSQYDGDGNLRNWWSAQDRERFEALTAKLVAQYAAYEPLPGHRVNGELTLGENIADNAGLAIAYKAYQLSLKGHPAPVIDGLTGDQRFFIGFAQVWRNKMQDAQMLKLLVTDPHAPARFRPNGAAVNADAFYQAFSLKPGDAMFKPEEERIHLW